MLRSSPALPSLAPRRHGGRRSGHGRRSGRLSDQSRRLQRRRGRRRVRRRRRRGRCRHHPGQLRRGRGRRLQRRPGVLPGGHRHHRRVHSDQDFATTIRTRASAGDAPDIALFPQPGGLLDLAAEGHVAPISDYLDVDSLQSSLISGFLESATLEDQIYAAPMRMAVKSLVWYPTAAYEEGGWSTEPATLQELYGIAEE